MKRRKKKCSTKIEIINTSPISPNATNKLCTATGVAMI